MFDTQICFGFISYLTENTVSSMSTSHDERL